MGLVSVVALVLSVAYLWRFGDDHGIVPFLLGCALLVVAVVHGIAWRESRSPLLIADLTGLRVRLGGGWTGLPWSEVEQVEVASRGRVGDGRLVVRAHDERRALAESGLRARFAVLLNRWLYDAPLVVPYGLTTTVSVDDIPGSLERLADGRAEIVVVAERVAEPEPTVEVSAAGTLGHADHVAAVAQEGTGAPDVLERSWFGTTLQPEAPDEPYDQASEPVVVTATAEPSDLSAASDEATPFVSAAADAETFDKPEDQPESELVVGSLAEPESQSVAEPDSEAEPETDANGDAEGDPEAQVETGDETEDAEDLPAEEEVPAEDEVAALAARDTPPATRRLVSLVSALRSQAGRRYHAATASAREPTTVGTLALSESLEQQSESLPELVELRRRAPEDDVVDPEAPARPANVALIIDSTTGLGEGDVRTVRPLSPPSGGGGPAAAVAAASISHPFPEHSYAGSLTDVPADAPAATTEARRPESSLPPEPLSRPAPSYATPANLVIGTQMRRAREWLDMSVDDLAERTRIRPFVIESIEVGDFSPCGGDFYARGHLRMLSSVLGIDPEPILASYDENIASAPVSPRAVFDAELSTGVLRPTGGGARWGALIGTVLVLLLVWGVARFFLTDQSNVNDSIVPPPTSNAAASPGIGDAGVPVVPPTHVTLASTGVSSRVVVWDKSMKVVFQGQLHPGQVKTVSGAGPLRVMAVDAGAVALTAPGHPKAPMGSSGQRIFVHVGHPAS